MRSQRRHLTDAQRAMIAAGMANLRQGRPEKTPDGTFKSEPPITRDDVKQLLHVLEGSLAQRVIRRCGLSTVACRVWIATPQHPFVSSPIHPISRRSLDVAPAHLLISAPLHLARAIRRGCISLLKARRSTRFQWPAYTCTVAR